MRTRQQIVHDATCYTCKLCCGMQHAHKDTHRDMHASGGKQNNKRGVVLLSVC